jgi:glucose-1-phosphate thymidylyltransferase
MMNLIIPMAGQGKRMRPHTLTTPKPLIPIAGKPIVARLVEEVAKLYQGEIAHIGFILSTMSADLQAQLQTIAQNVGAKAHFYEQSEALGTAHAIACAQELLQGRVIVAFADTLFQSSIPLDISQESVIWVKKVPDPSAFGVVKLDPHQLVNAFIEKPTSFVSDLAIIGIYYFQEGLVLRKAIQTIMEQNMLHRGEYQLTDALMLMQQQGVKFAVQEVDEWLDCGNKAATLHTNQRFLTLLQDHQDLIATSARIHNSIIIPPVYLGPEVSLENAIVGPYVSVGAHTHIENSRIQTSLIQTYSRISNASFQDSMLGNYVQLKGKIAEVDIGDYNTVIG